MRGACGFGHGACPSNSTHARGRHAPWIASRGVLNPRPTLHEKRWPECPGAFFSLDFANPPFTPSCFWNAFSFCGRWRRGSAWVL